VPQDSDPGPTPRPAPSELIAEIPIYHANLDGNWSLEHSRGITYTLSSTAYQRDGSPALAVTPLQDYGVLDLTLRPEASVAYRRDQILGVSFWLSGGDNLIRISDLAVTILGSNAYPYWVADDDSVKIEGRVTEEMSLFSETRLYYLGLNRSIQPNIWVEVIDWLDERKFDPEYTYVTGVYIKNDSGFRQTFYLDRISLLVEK
jgi:hypothetical protein